MNSSKYGPGLLLLLLSTVACGIFGAANEPDSSAEATMPATVTVSIAEVNTPETDPTPTLSSTTEASEAQATVSTVEIPEVAIATTSPEAVVPEVEPTRESTSEVKAEVSEGNNCEALYQELLAQFGEDYSQCMPDLSAGQSCEMPESLKATGTDLKEQVNIELILDASGSMAEQVGGQPKLDIAKEVLTDFVDTLPETANVALRVYGHVGSNNEADKAVSCAGTELLYPFQSLDKEKFKTAINSFQPTGWTPIAGSFQKAQKDFVQFPTESSSNFVYLVSDGIETCDGDPVAAAGELHESDVKAIVNIVGFDVDQEATAQLKAAAQRGGGQYYEARSAAELEQVFAQSFNWREWSTYHACVVSQSTSQQADVVSSQTEAFACVVTAATNEYANIIRESTSQYKKYGACQDYINTQGKARRDSLIEASQQQSQEAIQAAQQVREQAIEESEKLVPESTSNNN